MQKWISGVFCLCWALLLFNLFENFIYFQLFLLKLLKLILFSLKPPWAFKKFLLFCNFLFFLNFFLFFLNFLKKIFLTFLRTRNAKVNKVWLKYKLLFFLSFFSLKNYFFASFPPNFLVQQKLLNHLFNFLQPTLCFRLNRPFSS